MPSWVRIFSETRIYEALKAPLRQMRWLLRLFSIQLDHHGGWPGGKSSCGLNGFTTGGFDPPQRSRPDGAQQDVLKKKEKKKPCTKGVWFGRSSLAERCSRTSEPRLTEAGICQRSWQQPMGAQLQGEQRERESDVEEECIRHPESEKMRNKQQTLHQTRPLLGFVPRSRREPQFVWNAWPKVCGHLSVSDCVVLEILSLHRVFYFEKTDQVHYAITVTSCLGAGGRRLLPSLIDSMLLKRDADKPSTDSRSAFCVCCGTCLIRSLNAT